MGLLDLLALALPRDLRLAAADEPCSTAGGDDATRSSGTMDVRGLLEVASAFEKPGNVPVLSARGGEEEERASSPVGGTESRGEAPGDAAAGGFALTV
jgi:hypothetical protein